MAKNAKETQQMKHEGIVEILRYFYCFLTPNRDHRLYKFPYKPIQSIHYTTTIRASELGLPTRPDNKDVAKRRKVQNMGSWKGEGRSYDRRSRFLFKPLPMISSAGTGPEGWRIRIALRHSKKLKYIKKRIEVLLKVDYKIACVAAGPLNQGLERLRRGQITKLSLAWSSSSFKIYFEVEVNIYFTFRAVCSDILNSRVCYDLPRMPVSNVSYSLFVGKLVMMSFASEKSAGIRVVPYNLTLIWAELRSTR